VSTAWQRFSLHTEEGREDAINRVDRLVEIMRNSSNREIELADLHDQDPDATNLLFSGADIKNVDFDDKDVRRIDFRGSDLSGSTFRGSRILGCRFEMAKVARDALRRASDWQDYVDNWEPLPFREQLSCERLPLERFSVSPLLPEFAILPNDGSIDAESLPQKEARSLSTGGLAVSLTCISQAQFARILDGATGAGSSDEPIAVKWHSANTYLLGSNRMGPSIGLPRGASLSIPSAQLAFQLAKQLPDRKSEADITADIVLSAFAVAREGHEFASKYGSDYESVSVFFDDVVHRKNGALEISHGVPDNATRLRLAMHLDRELT
jgi:hypothetical protein